MSDPIGWGVVGTGDIAGAFARALAATPGAERAAVASSRPDRAQRFAAAHGFARAHADVASLVADEAVRIVYVASATRLHREHCLAALAAGKAVLCEKPFTASLADAEAVVAAARAAGVFCMEAMWLRFSDVVAEVRGLLARDALGEVASATISLGYAKPPADRRAAEDGGGALHVFGCYGLSLATHLFGPPRTCRSILRRDERGLDLDAALLLDHGAAVSIVDASIAATRANRFEIVGRDGIATIPAEVIDPRLLLVGSNGGGGGLGGLLAQLSAPLRARLPAARRTKGSGRRNQIAECMRCLRQGLVESPVMPLDESVAVQRLIEEARRGA